jgi:acyl carrier protein
MDSIKNEIKKFLIENFLFGDDSIEIVEDESLMDQGLIDSTGILELITFIENTYNIKIDNNEIIPENLDTLDNMQKFLSIKIEKNAVVN